MNSSSFFWQESESFSGGICDEDRRNTLKTSSEFSNSHSSMTHWKQSSTHKTGKTIKVRTTLVVQYSAEVVNQPMTCLREPKRDFRQKLMPFITMKTQKRAGFRVNWACCRVEAYKSSKVTDICWLKSKLNKEATSND